MEEILTYCAVHSDRETSLRCNQCDRYMCVECAVHTPVGYRCKQCVRQVDNKYFNAEPLDHWKVFGVALGVGILSGIVLALFPNLGFFLAVISGFPIGAIAAEGAVRSINRRKGRNHWQYGALGIVLGVLVAIFGMAFLSYPDGMRQLYEAYQTMSPQQQQLTRGARVGILSQSDYAIQHMLALPNLIFIAIASYSLYIRMKP